MHGHSHAVVGTDVDGEVGVEVVEPLNDGRVGTRGLSNGRVLTDDRARREGARADGSEDDELVMVAADERNRAKFGAFLEAIVAELGD